MRPLVLQDSSQLNGVQPKQFSFRFYRFSKREWDGLVCAPSPEDLMNVGNQERIVLKAKYNKYTE